MFYDNFLALCRSRNVKPGRVADEIGINRGTVTYWKKSGYTPRSEILQKVADYFAVSVDRLLGAEKTEAPQEAPDDTALKFALFGDTEVSDADLEDVKRYAAFVRERMREQKQDGTP